MSPTESDLVYVVVETSSLGQTVVGVYTSLVAARAILPPASSGRLNDFRVEARVLNAPPDDTAYQVVLDRDGQVEEAQVAIRCACEDDDSRLREGSYIERGGSRMWQIVWAASPGEAIAAAQEHRLWLLAQGFWTDNGRRIGSIQAGGGGDQQRDPRLAVAALA